MEEKINYLLEEKQNEIKFQSPKKNKIIRLFIDFPKKENKYIKINKIKKKKIDIFK